MTRLLFFLREIAVRLLDMQHWYASVLNDKKSVAAGFDTRKLSPWPTSPVTLMMIKLHPAVVQAMWNYYFRCIYNCKLSFITTLIQQALSDRGYIATLTGCAKTVLLGMNTEAQFS